MNNDTNQNPRLNAISSFLVTQPGAYLNILNSIRKQLFICLGSDNGKIHCAEEIIQEVMGDLIDGTRSWDMKKYNIAQVLRMNAKSEISNLVKKECRYILTGNNPGRDDDDPDGDMDKLVNTLPDDIEGSIDAEEIENYCTDVILRDDEDAPYIFDDMLEGKTQKQISVNLGIPLNKVENTIRKIRRNISQKLPIHFLENIPLELKLKILNYK